jgi:hypothetical protein
MGMDQPKKRGVVFSKYQVLAVIWQLPADEFDLTLLRGF